MPNKLCCSGIACMFKVDGVLPQPVIFIYILLPCIGEGKKGQLFPLEVKCHTLPINF